MFYNVLKSIHGAKAIASMPPAYSNLRPALLIIPATVLQKW